MMEEPPNDRPLRPNEEDPSGSTGIIYSKKRGINYRDRCRSPKTA